VSAYTACTWRGQCHEDRLGMVGETHPLDRAQDGTRLVTLGDVRAFILKQPEHIQERGSWQHAAELLILAAERGGSIEAATTQIEDALFLEARYVRQWH
jgi:hypothetical protein